MDWEKEEMLLGKIGAKTLSPLELESAGLIAGKRTAQSLLSDSQSSPIMSTSQMMDKDRDDEDDETDILDYKREKEEEEEEEGRFTPEEVGIMASKYPYSSMYRNLKVNKQAGSPWFVIENNGQVAAIVPVAPAATKSEKQAKLAAQGLLRQIASEGLVRTIKSRGGRVAQAGGDPGVVGGGLRDFMPPSDPAADQSVKERADSDMTMKRTPLYSEPISPGESPDHTRPHDPKSLRDMVMDDRTTDFAVGEEAVPPMPLNVTDRQDSDMRYQRPPKNVMDNALEERTTDMRQATRRPNPWTQKVAYDPNRDPGFDIQPPDRRPGPGGPNGGWNWPEPPGGGDVQPPEPPVQPPDMQPPSEPPGQPGFPRYPGPPRRPGEPEVIPLEGSRPKEAVTPPGMEKTVEKLQKDPGVDNPWAVAWSIYNKKKGQVGAIGPAVESAGYGAVGQQPPPKPKSTWEKITAPIQDAQPSASPTVVGEEQRQLRELEKMEQRQYERNAPQFRRREKDENDKDKDEEDQEKDGKCKKGTVSVSSDDFKTIVADIENRIAKRSEKRSESWKKAYGERLMRSILLAADRQRLNQEPCSLKMAMGDVLEQPQRLAGIPMEGMSGDMIYSIVEAAFQSGSDPFIKSLIRQAMKFMDMPQEAFLAIEADTRRLQPVDVRTAADDENGNGEDLEEMIEDEIEDKVEENGDEENGNGNGDENDLPPFMEEDEYPMDEKEALRRRAARGNLVLAASPRAGQIGHQRFAGLRDALRSPLTDKFPKLLG